MGLPNGTWTNEMGHGIVDAEAAVNLAKSISDNNNVRCPEPHYCYSPPADRIRNPSEIRVAIDVIFFPNPFDNTITFRYELTSPEMVSLTITDAIGKNLIPVFKEVMQKAGTNEIEVNGQHLPAGLYFFTLKAGDKTQTQKLIKIE